jgi:hypothetical protein
MIAFNSRKQFDTSKRQLMTDIMEVMATLTVEASHLSTAENLVRCDGTCQSSGCIADRLETVLMRFSMNNEHFTKKVLAQFLLAADTCLLAFYLVGDRPSIFRNEGQNQDNRPSSAQELLMMLLRQVVLKMMYYNTPTYIEFSASHHFTPIRMNHATTAVHDDTGDAQDGDNTNDNTVVLLGPFGCTERFDNNEHLWEPYDDIIVDVPTTRVHDMFLALAMGSHIRLGESSPLLSLPVDVLGELAKHTLELF